MTITPIRTGRAIIYPYFEDQDLSAGVSGTVVELDYPLRCLSFQGLVTGGAPQGTLKVQMSIIENVWTDLGACKPVSICLLYTSPSPRDGLLSRMPSSA